MYLLLVDFHVPLHHLDASVPRELLRLDEILAIVVVLGDHRGAEVVALDGDVVRFEEARQAHDPSTSGVVWRPRLEHDLIVAHARRLLVRFD